MSFMQKSILFWESMVVNSFLLAVCIGLIYYDDTCFYLFIVPAFLLLVTLILQLICKKPVVTISENGILCQSGTQVLWSYRWSEIAELQIGNEFRNPCVNIYIYSACSLEEKIYSKSWFQLGFRAQKAIKKYGPDSIIR